MAKTVAAKFARLQPDYYIKMFSDNPLNAEDLPDQLEVELLRRFRENRELKSIVETGTINSKPYLLSLRLLPSRKVAYFAMVKLTKPLLRFATNMVLIQVITGKLAPLLAVVLWAYR